MTEDHAAEKPKNKAELGREVVKVMDEYEKLMGLEAVPAGVKDLIGEMRDGRLELRQLYEKMSKLIDEEIGEEAKEWIVGMQKRVKEYMEGEENMETFAGDSTVDRMQRSVEVAEMADKLRNGEKLSEKQIRAAEAIVGREYWGKMIRSLKKGDKLVAVLVPGAEFLKVKYLNDEIFTPTITDGILEKKRKLVEEKMKGEVLMHDYKSDFIKLPENISPEQISSVMEEIDKEMTAYIVGIVDSLMNLKSTDEKKKVVLKKFISQLTGNKGGYKLNFGTTNIEGDTMDDKLWAIAKASQTCLTGREKGRYGTEADEMETVGEVNAIKELRGKIMDSGNMVFDESGNAFEVFIKKDDGKWMMNRDVLRDVRKGKFKPGKGKENEHVTVEIYAYVKKINVIDSVKPFVHDEIKDAEEKIKENGEIAENIEGNSLKAAEKLDTDEKDPNFTSRDRFNKMAAEMPNCQYVSIDVLDLGVDQLLEYESLLQEVEESPEADKKKKLKEISLKSGDQTTERLKTFREITAQVVREKLHLKKDEKILGSVGGDELMLAFDGQKIKQEEIEEIIFEAKKRLKELESKVEIRVAVAEAKKNIKADLSQQEKVAAHVDAVSRTEAATIIAKEIEDEARKLNFKKIKAKGNKDILKKLGELRGLMTMSAEDGRARFSPNCMVVEKDGEFIVTYRAEKDGAEETVSLQYSVIKELLKDLSETVSKEEKKEAAAA
jgi:hypothetical protein